MDVVTLDNRARWGGESREPWLWENLKIAWLPVQGLQDCPVGTKNVNQLAAVSNPNLGIGPANPGAQIVSNVAGGPLQGRSFAARLGGSNFDRWENAAPDDSLAGLTEFTMEIWYWIDASFTWENYITGSDGGSHVHGIGIWTTNTTRRPGFRISNGVDVYCRVVDGQITVPFDTWFHMAYTFRAGGTTDDDKVQIYFDGEGPLSFDVSGGALPASVTSVPLTWRFWAGDRIRHCAGVRVWGKHFTHDQMVRLYQDGRRGFPSMQRVPLIRVGAGAPAPGNLSGEGGLSIGGEGNLRERPPGLTGAGGLSFAGAGNLRAKPGPSPITGAGGLSLGGSGELRDVQRINGQGGLEIGGEGTLRNAQTLLGAAGLTIGGSGIIRDGSTLNGQGGLSIGGEGNLGSRVALKGAAGLAFAGVGLLRDSVAPTAVHIDDLLFALTGSNRLYAGLGENRLTAVPEGKQ